MRGKGLLIWSLVLVFAIVSNWALAENTNTPVKIKLRSSLPKSAKKGAVVLATVIQDVVDDKGNVILTKGSKVYGVLKEERSLGLIYVEFLYAVGKNNKKIPVKGYIIGQKVITPVYGKIFQYMIGLLFPPFLVSFIVKDIKNSAQAKKYINSYFARQAELWITIK